MAATTSKAEPTVSMEEEIWKNFPEDLFPLVLARLPVAALFRSRLVSRKWNSVPALPAFSHHLRRETWVYALAGEHSATGSVYDPSSNKWRPHTIPALLETGPVFPVASASSLVCFLHFERHELYVCNPLTRSARRLLVSPAGPMAAFGMASGVGGGYRLVWVGPDGRFGRYDSGRGEWDGPRSVPPEVSLPLWLGLRSQSATVGCEVYFLRAAPEGVVSYNVDSGTWRQYVIPPPAHVADRALAVGAAGGLLLVALQTKNAATCVCVWELQRMSLLWKEVDRMPNLWCLDLYGKPVRMCCLGNTGRLLLSLRSGHTDRLVSYDTAGGGWAVVPGGSGLTCGAAFQPSPTAMA